MYEALKRATDPLDQAWAKLKKARRIAIKFNQDKMLKQLVMYENHRQQLVSDSVVRATLRLLRERTNAKLYCIDVSFYQVYAGAEKDSTTNIRHVLKEFDVEYVNGNVGDVRMVPVPGGGLMFDKYPLLSRAVDADAMISVQKLKNHAFMGVTLCLKNLFGITPTQPQGRPRFYYHHLVRMPYMLADLGRIYNPTLNIIDGLVGQAGEEWGKGDHPRICNTLIAGDQVIATDAVGSHLMGHDPQADWLTPPFHRDRNALLCAAEGGFGTVNLDEIDWQSEVQAPVGQFFTKTTDSQQTVTTWRRTTAEQALYYLDHRKELQDKYPGEYVLMQMGEVKWHDKSGVLDRSRRILSGDHPEQAMWFKYIDPEETEREHFEMYERTLQQIKALQQVA
ncbi:MAG: DUF362 domain-containing protein [Chloroflexi bacterium]|nr:DUF362 domain-containing protein [Chloroflexota bacterium]